MLRPAAELASEVVQPLTILTWNTLAPVYFRQERFRGGLTEADSEDTFIQRHTKICEVLSRSSADIICLQEYWFAPKMRNLYGARLSHCSGFRSAELQRTGMNCDGRSEDGVAVFWRDSVELLERIDVKFHDYGIAQDRVALLLLLACRRPAGGGAAVASGAPRRLALLCTHLTYPHSRCDVAARHAQMAACLDAVRRHVAPGLPLVVAGDLNGPSEDGVSECLRRAGFQNVWEEVHGRPCCSTHIDHRGDSFASDHVWVRGPLVPHFASLLPEGFPDNREMKRPVVGAGRGGRLPFAAGSSEGTEDEVWDAWCQLSDHRPLVVGIDCQAHCVYPVGDDKQGQCARADKEHGQAAS